MLQRIAPPVRATATSRNDRCGLRLHMLQRIAVPGGALGVSWESLLDLLGSKNGALTKSSDVFLKKVVKNGPSN